jgi:hypothetical protein
MGWSCTACSVRNENDAQVTCAACSAIRVLECPTCHGEIKCVPDTYRRFIVATGS